MSYGNIQIVYYIWAAQSTANDVAAKRKANFAEHMAWLQARSEEGTIQYGGGVLTEDQKLPLTSEPELAGLMLIVKADNLEAARKFLEQDPYYKAGVWDTANIKTAPVITSDGAQGAGVSTTGV